MFQEKYFLKEYNKRIIRKKRGKTKTEKKAEGGVCCGRVGVLSPAGHKKKQLSDDSDRIMLLIYTLGSPKPPVEIVYKESLSLSFS